MYKIQLLLMKKLSKKKKNTFKIIEIFFPLNLSNTFFLQYLLISQFI